MKNTQTEQRAIEKLKWKNFGGGLYFAPGWKIAKRVNTVTGRKRRPVQKTIWNLTLISQGETYQFFTKKSAMNYAQAITDKGG